MIRTLSLIIATQVAVIFWQHNLPPEVTLVIGAVLICAIIFCLTIIKNRK